jgi:type VI secretion system protein VasG
VMQACLNRGEEALPTPDALADTLRPTLYKAFPAAFLGRVNVVPYYPLPDDVLADIIELKLKRIAARVAAHHRAEFVWDDSLVDTVLARCAEVDSGARNIDRILSGTVLPDMSQRVLERIAAGETIARIGVSVSEAGEIAYEVQ